MGSRGRHSIRDEREERTTSDESATSWSEPPDSQSEPEASGTTGWSEPPDTDANPEPESGAEPGWSEPPDS